MKRTNSNNALFGLFTYGCHWYKIITQEREKGNGVTDKEHFHVFLELSS